jgi:CHAD domain-containing protein
MLHGLEEGQVRAVHRMRVASRRLREILPVLQLDNDRSAKLGRRLRKVTRRLGTVRELDVMLVLLEELQALNRYPSRAVNAVRRSIQGERRQVQKRLMAKLPLIELRRLGRRLTEAVDRLQVSESGKSKSPEGAWSWRWATEARVARRSRRLQTAIDRAGSVYLPERLHEVRIALKKLRYALEVATEAAGASESSDLRTLKHVQDVLGRLHDFQVLITRARGTFAALGPTPVTAGRDFETFIDVLEDDCRRMHGRYMHDRDAVLAVCRRLTGRLPASAGRRASA